MNKCVDERKRSLSIVAKLIADSIAKDGQADAEKLRGIEIHYLSQLLQANKQQLHPANPAEYDSLIAYTQHIQRAYDDATEATDFYMVEDQLRSLSRRIADLATSE